MLVDMVKERGFRDGGYIRVAHCFAEEAADFREALLAEFPMPALCWSRRRRCAATMRKWAV